MKTGFDVYCFVHYIKACLCNYTNILVQFYLNFACKLYNFTIIVYNNKYIKLNMTHNPA